MAQEGFQEGEDEGYEKCIANACRCLLEVSERDQRTFLQLPLTPPEACISNQSIRSQCIRCAVLSGPSCHVEAVERVSRLLKCAYAPALSRSRSHSSLTHATTDSLIYDLDQSYVLEAAPGEILGEAPGETPPLQEEKRTGEHMDREWKGRYRNAKVG